VRNPIIDAFERFLLRYFTYLQTIHIKDMITMFTALYAGSVLTLCIFLWIWIKAKVVFEDIKDPNIIVARFYVGGVYETQVRSDVFKSFSSILNVTFALIIANHTKNTKVFVWQVRKLEKLVAVAFAIALLLAAFGVMCALDTELPPGYKLPVRSHSEVKIIK
jgi:type IV secretory pathway VirB3-like protein